MRIAALYSHLNGKEYLLVHRRHLWEEVREVIEDIDASNLRTKVSQERRNQGKYLFSPKALNLAFKEGFRNRGWGEHRTTFWIAVDEKVMRAAIPLDTKDQKQMIKEAGFDPIMSYNQTDFVKDRVAVEVQFGKYSFVAHDIFVKHLNF